MCYNLTASQLLEHCKLVTSYCSIILEPWSWCCFIQSFSLPFFPEKTTCNPYSCIVFLFLCYHKSQVENLKFIKDKSQSQDVKIVLSYRHEPQKAMSCSFRQCNIHNSEKEVLEPPVSGPWICAQHWVKWDSRAVSSVRKAIQLKTYIE